MLTGENVMLSITFCLLVEKRGGKIVEKFMLIAIQGEARVWRRRKSSYASYRKLVIGACAYCVR